jgi:hypothetical protein
MTTPRVTETAITREGCRDTGKLHGPWSHPHTEQAYDLLRDPYANDHAQRTAAQEFFRLSMPERWKWNDAR